MGRLWKQLGPQNKDMSSSNHRFSGGKLLVSERLVSKHLGSWYIFSWGAKFMESSWSDQSSHFPHKKHILHEENLKYLLRSLDFFWKHSLEHLYITFWPSGHSFLSNKSLQIGFLRCKNKWPLPLSLPWISDPHSEKVATWLFQWNSFDFTTVYHAIHWSTTEFQPVCLLLVNIL